MNLLLAKVHHSLVRNGDQCARSVHGVPEEKAVAVRTLTAEETRQAEMPAPVSYFPRKSTAMRSV